MMGLIIGIAGSTLIAGLAYWKRSLSRSGVIAAIIVGTSIYAMGSPAWFGTLLAFFISSTLLSKWKRRAKELAESGYEKGGRRDAGQVFANGGLAMLLCAASYFAPHPIWWAAFIGAIATVTADTWATEVGALSKSAPRSILTGKRVPPGTSGGISLLGTGAAIAGGMFIGTAAWLFTDINIAGGGRGPLDQQEWVTLLQLGFFGGMAGALADSVIGARWQVMYVCSYCGREIEQREHCGKPTRPIRGYTFLNNDAVNFLSSMAGALTAVLVDSIIL